MASEIYELRIGATCGNDRVETVMHFVGGNLTADATLDNGNYLLDAFVTNVLAAWMNMFPDNYVLLNLQARRATPKPSAVTFADFPQQVQVGQFGTGQATRQLCPVLFLIPGMGFKSGGKIFLPAVPNSAVVNNTYGAGYITIIDTFVNLVLANFGTSGKTWQIAIYSRKLATYSIAVGANLSLRFGFQKRRRRPT